MPILEIKVFNEKLNKVTVKMEQATWDINEVGDTIGIFWGFFSQSLKLRIEIIGKTHDIIDAQKSDG